MTVIVSPQRASPKLLTPLAELIASHPPALVRQQRTTEHHVVDDIQKSESAWILFTHKEGQTEEQYVIKLLCPYNDRRYHLGSLSRRQKCQITALAFNETFSPDVYLGLVSTYQLQLPQARLTIGRPTHTTTELDRNTEYALVMHRLPSENRLDFLLEHKDKDTLRQYIHSVVQRIVEIHSTIPELPLKESKRWGGFQNLKGKLEHNISLARPLLEDTNSILQGRFALLEANLQQVLTRYPYAKYFEKRVNNYHIKHCHGDLKGPNIWIKPRTDALDYCQIAILDAIDFNPTYSNIDTLSDFATLIVDIQTRLLSTDFAHELTQEVIEQYLLITNQHRDEGARAVLHYYLVEKAFVGAAISLVYDDLPELGERFLCVAEACWNNYFASRPKASTSSIRLYAQEGQDAHRIKDQILCP